MSENLIRNIMLIRVYRVFQKHEILQICWQFISTYICQFL